MLFSKSDVVQPYAQGIRIIAKNDEWSVNHALHLDGWLASPGSAALSVVMFVALLIYLARSALGAKKE